MNQTAQRETNLEQVERRERSRIRERDADAAGRRVDGRSQRRRAIERGGESGHVVQGDGFVEEDLLLEPVEAAVEVLKPG